MFFYDPGDFVILSSIFADSFGYLADYPKISITVPDVAPHLAVWVLPAHIIIPTHIIKIMYFPP